MDKGLRAILALILLFVFTACTNTDPGITDPPPPPPPPDPTVYSPAYDTYNATLPSWSEFAPVVPDADEPIPDTRESFNELVGNAVYECTTEQRTLTSNPKDIVTFEPDLGALWVGGLLQGRHYAEGVGALAELPIRERAPLTLFVNKFGGRVSTTIDEPNVASVQQAISDLIIEMQQSGLSVASDLYFQQTTAYEADQALLSLGLSARYAGAKVKAAYSTERAANESRITAHFVQELFSIAMVSPSTPGSLFTSDLTQEQIDAQVALGRLGPDNVPVYIASITYGRILHFTMTASASEETLRTILNASYSGLAGKAATKLTQEQQRILQESTIEVTALGGDESNAREIIRTGDLRSYFNEAAPLTTAVPISYEIHNLGDDSNATVSETTNYTVRDCSWPTEETITDSLRGSARTAWNGSRNWWRDAETLNLFAGAYFTQVQAPEVSVSSQATGHYCRVREYTNFEVITLADGRTHRVPRSVIYEAGVRSGNGANVSASITCAITFDYIQR